MKVYFRDSQHNKRFLGKAETKENAWKIIQKFMDDHNFTCYYTRVWFQDGYTWYDVGSHTEFFLIDKNLMEQYENEQEEERTIYCTSKRNKKPLVINQNKLNLQKEYHPINFRTGGYITEKDRPRKKFKPKDVDYE